MNQLASPGQLRASFLRWALVLVPIVVLGGFVSSLVSGNVATNLWFNDLAKPALYPPPETFSIVWTVLYIVMGLAVAMVAAARGAPGRGLAIALFFVQRLLNLAWSPLFFGLHEMTKALWLLVVLDVAVLATIAAFWRVRMPAALLLVPYLAWLLFATVLNWQFLEANPDADGGASASSVTRMQF
ncbi:MAG: tryptophan-rich sensory protein [Sphingomonadales bacterium]|nr:tryptophan-rich sensory protein [Sphingomonadales bacterium]